MPDLEPITREEMLLDGQDLEPITRKEMFIKRIYDKTQVVPEPITREEMFLKKAGDETTDVTIEQLNVSANGTYSESGKAYSPVIVNVPAPPIPDNAYLLNEVEGLPKDIATFTDGSNLPMPSLKVGIEPIQEGSGDPSPTNIRPISGWSGANVTRVGKNLWGGEKLADDIVAKVPQATKDTTNKTVTYYASQVTRIPLFDKFKANTQYTIYLSTTSTYSNANIIYSDGTYDGIEPNTYKVTYANKTVSEIRGAWASGTTVLKYDECGLFEGVITADDFEPYNGTTYNIQFKDGQGNPITVYGGECDVVNGTSGNENTLGSVDMGDLNWTLENGIFRLNESIGAKLTSDTSAVANMMCSHYKTVSQNAMGSTTTDQCVAGLNWSNGVRVKDSNYTDVASFKQAMSGVQLVYELATPTTFESIATPVKSLLGSNNVWCDTGKIEELEYFSKEV